MAIDKVRPIAYENIPDGGGETLPVPTEMDPSEDYASVHGVAFDDLDTHLIDRNGNNIQVTDPTVGTKSVDDLQSTVRVSSNDTTPSNLLAKLAAGTGITLTEQNDGGNETLRIASSTGTDFGSDYDYAESNGESSTTSYAYQQKLRLTTGVIPAGDYLIFYTLELTNSDEDKPVKTQVEIDDTNQVHEGWDAPAYQNGGNKGWSTRTGFVEVTLTNASHTIDIDYSSTEQGGTAYIRRARIAIWGAT